MSRPYKPPIASYEEAYATLPLEELARWVWKHRVMNSLMKARQRHQNVADIALVSRRGKKLRHRDNEVVNLIQMRLISAGYRFDPPRVIGNDEVVCSRVRISPVRPTKRTVEVVPENQEPD